MKKYSTLILSAFLTFMGTQARAQTFVTITPTGASAATVTNRWAIGGGLSGLAYDDSNSGFSGATGTNFFTITGAVIPALGSPAGFTSYLPTGAASPQASVGNALTPNSYSGLTYVAENLSLIGPLSFYAIHHGLTGDYLALIQPGVPTVSDQKPMSGPGGPLTAGGTGYFALSYAADNPGGWGAQLFYYLRTNTLGETIFGSMIPALLSGPTDQWDLGAGRGFTDLAYTSTDLGFGFGPSKFYYLRLDPVTQTTFFGCLDPLTGTTTDIQNLGGVYRTLTFTTTNVGYGANNFYSIGGEAQTITFAPIPDHTACDAPFTVAPTASSSLLVTLAVTSGPATVSGDTVTLTGTGSVTLQATQVGNGTYASAPPVSQTFAVAACPAAPTPQTITFAPIPGHTACDASFTAGTPTASSGLPVTLVVTSGPATVSGSNVVTLTGAVGTVVLTASQAGDSTFAPAPSVAQSFAVAACPSPPAPPASLTPQTIIFAPVPAQGLCEGPFTVTPAASSGLPVTLVVTSGPATVSGDTVTMTGAGSVTLEATQAGDGTYASAPSVSQTFAVAKCVAAVSLGTLTTGYHQAPFNPLYWTVTTTPAGLAVIETFNGSTTPPVGPGTYTVVATINDPNYTGTATTTLVLSPDLRVAQTVSFGVPPITNHVFGDPPFTLNPTSSSGMPTVLSVTSGPATVSGNTVTMTGVGTVVLEVSQAGDIQNYFFAYLSQSFVVAQAIVGSPNYQDSPDPTLTVGSPSPLLNVSIFGQVGSAQTAITAGFVIAGTGTKLMLLRGVGPSLAGYGVTEALSAPMLQLYDGSGNLLLSNSGWAGSSSLSSLFTQVGAFPLSPGSVDAAASTTLSPGSYTLIVSGVSGATGTALAEVYDASPNPLTQTTAVSNVSSLGQVSPDSPVTAGFVIGGGTPTQVLIRGVGPGLGSFGLTDAISDPFLSLSDGNSHLIAQNGSWGTALTVNNSYPGASAAGISAAASSVGAFPLGAGSNDSAILVTLPPGTYSAQVSTAGAATGTALLEVYELP